jgi:hypothetical protein
MSDHNTDAFEISSPAARKERLFDKHTALKNQIMQHPIVIEFSKLMAEITPLDSTAEDRAVILGAIVEFSYGLMSTAAVVLGLNSSDTAIENAAGGIIEYGKKTLVNQMKYQSSISGEQIDAYIKELEARDPETFAALTKGL